MGIDSFALKTVSSFSDRGLIQKPNYHDDVMKWKHFRVAGHLCGEFTGPGEFPTQRPVARSFDIFFNLRLNNRLSKQSWGWWFETLSWSLWRHCNGLKFPTKSSKRIIVCLVQSSHVIIPLNIKRYCMHRSNEYRSMAWCKRYVSPSHFCIQPSTRSWIRFCTHKRHKRLCY